MSSKDAVLFSAGFLDNRMSPDCRGAWLLRMRRKSCEALVLGGADDGTENYEGNRFPATFTSSRWAHRSHFEKKCVSTRFARRSPTSGHFNCPFVACFLHRTCHRVISTVGSLLLSSP